MRLLNFNGTKSALLALIIMFISCTVNAGFNELYTNKYADISAIRLQNIEMKINISTHSKKDVEIKLFGPEKNHDLVDIHKDGSELVVNQIGLSHTVGDVSVITHSIPGGNGSRSTVTIGGETTVIEGGGVVITRSTPEETMYMEIKVPAGTPLSLVDFSGKASIGDIHSSFYMQGSGKVIAGSLTDVDVDLYKNAKVEIDQVEQYLTVTATDNSKLRLKNGDVKKIQAHLTGNSRVKYEGHAHMSEFFVTDNGKLYVSSIQQRGKSMISRNGQVTVGNW